MTCTRGLLLLLLGLPGAEKPREAQDKPATPAEQYEGLLKQFNEAARVSYLDGKSDEARQEAVARIVELSPRFLELAETNSKDPVALDALVQVVNLELYLENNTTHLGRGKQSLEARAIAILLRDHMKSDQLAEACRRTSYGFSRECETFMREVLEMSPHKDVRALACLRLPQFLKGRLQRLDVIQEQPAMAKRYEGLFGRDYLETLRSQDRAAAVMEIETIFERAAQEFGDVKVPYGDTVGAKAKSELHEIRHLSIGKEAPDIDGADQDGERFKLSDYRGKVVLLYFWSEY